MNDVELEIVQKIILRLDNLRRDLMKLNEGVIALAADVTNAHKQLSHVVNCMDNLNARVVLLSKGYEAYFSGNGVAVVPEAERSPAPRGREPR